LSVCQLKGACSEQCFFDGDGSVVSISEVRIYRSCLYREFNAVFFSTFLINNVNQLNDLGG
jgi:hypothetical protein